MATTTVKITGERLGAMDDNDMSVYCTPGSSQPYWANRANFTYDERVATVQDFYNEFGIEREDLNVGGEYDEEVFEIEVELVEAR